MMLASDTESIKMMVTVFISFSVFIIPATLIL